MDFILHIVIMFIFIFVLLMLNFPKLSSNDYLLTKIYLFVSIFIFESVLQIIFLWRNSKIINFATVLQKSLFSSLFAVVGYSVYCDIAVSKKYSLFNDSDKIVSSGLITVIVVLAMGISYAITTIFTKISPPVDSCLNEIFKN